MVMGSYVESGRTFRLTLALHDTHASRLWTDEMPAPGRLMALIDRIAGRVFDRALRSQPTTTQPPCSDTPARPRARSPITGTSADRRPSPCCAPVAATGTSATCAFQEQRGSYATGQALRHQANAVRGPPEIGPAGGRVDPLRVAVPPVAGGVAGHGRARRVRAACAIPTASA